MNKFIGKGDHGDIKLKNKFLKDLKTILNTVIHKMLRRVINWEEVRKLTTSLTLNKAAFLTKSGKEEKGLQPWFTLQGLCIL